MLIKTFGVPVIRIDPDELRAECPEYTGANAIVREIYTALEKLGAPYKLLAAVGSWGDTAEDAETLELLKTWNETGDIKLDPPQRLS